MNNIDKYVEELILFAYKEIEENTYNRNNVTFNFSFGKIEKYLSNHPDEKIPEGEDLSEFKKKTKLTDNDTIKKALVKSMNGDYFKRTAINGEFNNLEFTDKGMRMANAILLNKKESKKKLIIYPFEKIILPVIIATIIGLITSFITTEYQNDKVIKKIENLEKEIKWLKEQK
ncbi:MAG: hypothetical protein AB7V28_13335 [Arcobacteraceae bacterium]